MPGKVSRKQALKFAEAFLKGQPHKATIASTLFRDKLSELRS
jgi:pyruvate dehydrogenase (quinone)/pyruvate oxidase